MTDKVKNAVENVIGKPVICEFSGPIQKVRTTLFFFSIVGLAVTLGGLTIDHSSSFLGLKFSNLTHDFVQQILFWVILYLIIHFTWGSIDCFVEWRLRLTGTRVSYITAAAYTSEHGDYPGDPRQSTLHNWWKNQASKIGNLKEKTEIINQNLEQCLIELSKKVEEKSNPSWSGFQSNQSQAITNLNNLINAVKEAEKTISAQRIPTSLARFDNWFKFFLRSQNLRWLVIEFSLPIVLGLFALWSLN
jgi:hypothetical protein